MRLHRGMWLACALAVAPHALPAQESAIAAVVSTLGLGGEVSVHLTRRVGVRGGYYRFSMTRTSDIENIRYELSPYLRNGAAALDLRPFGNAFRLTAGAVWSGTRVEGRAVRTEPLEIGGRTYQPEEVGELLARAEYRRGVMPFVGFGCVGGGKVALTVDVGLAFSGYPEVRLIVHSPLSGPERAELEASVAEEEASIRGAIRERRWTRFYPLVAIGLKVRR